MLFFICIVFVFFFSFEVESRLSPEVSHNIESIEITRKRKGVDSVIILETGTQVYSVDSADDSDSNDSEEGDAS